MDEDPAFGVPGLNEHAAVAQTARVRLPPRGLPDDPVVLVHDVEDLVSGTHAHIQAAPETGITRTRQ
jgi:hypothetical protein